MRLSWIAIVIAVVALQVSRAPAPPAAVVVVAPKVPVWPCDEACYIAMDRVVSPYDCLGCPAGLRGPWAR